MSRSNLENKTFSHFNGLDMTVYNKDKEYAGELGAITWGETDEDGGVQGELYFALDHGAREELTIDLKYTNEYGQSTGFILKKVTIGELKSEDVRPFKALEVINYIRD